MENCDCWSKAIDYAIASFIYENALLFNVADSQTVAALIDQCIEFSQQHQEHKDKVPNHRRISAQFLESAYENTAQQQEVWLKNSMI